MLLYCRVPLKMQVVIVVDPAAQNGRKMAQNSDITLWKIARILGQDPDGIILTSEGPGPGHAVPAGLVDVAVPVQETLLPTVGRSKVGPEAALFEKRALHVAGDGVQVVEVEDPGDVGPLGVAGVAVVVRRAVGDGWLDGTFGFRPDLCRYIERQIYLYIYRWRDTHLRCIPDRAPGGRRT